MGRIWLMWACLFGFLTVGLGAMTGHGLEATLDAKRLGWLATGNTYLAYHTFALLALGLWSHWEKWSVTLWAGIFFILGIFLFTGSLYALALFDWEMAKYVTPAGGICFLIGWIQFGISVVRTQSPLV